MSKTPSNTEKGTVPKRRPNADVRSREYLTPKEVDLLIATARKRNRYGHRDSALILLAYRHGLRPSEAVALQWDQFDLTHATMHVSRLKNGRESVHPVAGDELRALRKLRREEPMSPYLFLTERGAPMTTAGFRKLFARLGVAADIPFSIHPHMLRHATGYKLANDAQDTRAIQLYLGHKNIQNTTVYTELSPERFKSFWRL